MNSQIEQGRVIKKILVIHYSQTGQLSDVVQSLLAPLRQAENIQVCEEVLKPIQAYPFPWSLFTFLDAFPESVRLDPAPIEPLTVDADEPFDLVVLAYQVWYLSPSPPITAFLTSAAGRRLLAGKPVVTVVACRNMWLMAQETVKRLLHEAGAHLCDNIAFVDRANVLATLITTPRWLLTGRRDKFFGLPRAGIAEEDIAGAARFGHALAEALANDKEKDRAPLLTGLCAAEVDTAMIMSERAGHRAFRVWSGIIRSFGKPGQWQRRPALALFVVYLIVMIATVVPLSMILRRVLAPLLRKRLDAMKAYYEQPSGNADFRLSRLPHHE